MKLLVRKLLPWWLLVAIKVILARLPISYSFWKRLHLFEHGDMNQPERALEIFLTHAATGGVLSVGTKAPYLNVKSNDFSVLEFGPGDSLFTAMIAKSLGATEVWLIDAGDYVAHETAAYATLGKLLLSYGFECVDTTVPRSIEEVLRINNGRYLSNGVASISLVPDRSIDFCFSNAVLEHIPKKDFAKLADELHRVIKVDGVCVHRVDLKDHIGGALNNLRFSDDVWEGHLFRNSGFYTNRIRFSEMLNIFEHAGFDCQVTRKVTWDKLPTSRSVMARKFSELPKDELRVSGFDLVLRRKVIN